MLRLTRFRKRLTAIASIASLAFAQAVVAMHGGMGAAPAAGAVEMPCHDAPPAPDALCKAHCQADEQTVDQAKPLAAADAAQPLVAVIAFEVGAPAPRAVRAEPVLAHASSPPLPILYRRLRN